jgi:hypothetical protein
VELINWVSNIINYKRIEKQVLTTQYDEEINTGKDARAEGDNLVGGKPPSPLPEEDHHLRCRRKTTVSVAGGERSFNGGGVEHKQQSYKNKKQ